MKLQKEVFFILFLAILMLIQNCKEWEKDVSVKGLHFTKLSKNSSGAIIGYMSEDNIVQGFPCKKGWIHFKQNWELQSFQLSEPFSFRGTKLPAHSWVHFLLDNEKSGYIISFPENITIQGFLCKGTGGYKGTHTSFYKSGRLRSFFAPKDVVIDEIPCKGSLFANIKLYENGKLQSCKLSKTIEIDGKKYKKGSTLNFDKNNEIK